RREIEADARVNAALAEMAVVSADAQTVLLEDGVEAAQKGAQLRGRNGGIFGAGPGSRQSGKIGAGSQPRLANLPNCELIARVHHDRGADAFGNEGRLGHHLLGTLARVVFAIAADFRNQEGMTVGQQAHTRKAFLARELW